MSLTLLQTAHILFALTLLLVSAHGVGFLFMRARQPRVIGEIIGGLVLGPTCLGTIAPSFQARLFPPDDGATFPVLAATYELGLLLLMFCSGLEMKSRLQRDERRTVACITVAGTVLPFLLGLSLIHFGRVGGIPFLDVVRFYGPAAHDTAFLLVFAIAIAVTSIPVISRIMLDLGLLETAFARIVLGAAILEDVILYVVLAMALGMVGRGPEDTFGLPVLLDVHGDGPGSTLYHVLAPLLFIAASLAAGPRLFAWLHGLRFNLLARSSPIAFLLVFMLLMTGICVLAGITPMFGAFVAGMVVGTRSPQLSEPRGAIRQFAFAFFIPIYFAIVGLKLDLARNFDVLYFLFFLAFACAAKSLSVYAGARVARETRAASINLAVAMNARGGPGIVLSSVAFDAGIIGEPFYAKLVLLAVVTSLLAGFWLDRATSRGLPLR
jgi:Kef-type K+ transport system membrane component KefB